MTLSWFALFWSLYGYVMTLPLYQNRYVIWGFHNFISSIHSWYALETKYMNMYQITQTKK